MFALRVTDLGLRGKRALALHGLIRCRRNREPPCLCWARRDPCTSSLALKSSGFRVQGLGSGVQGLGFRVQGPGFRV